MNIKRFTGIFLYFMLFIATNGFLHSQSRVANIPNGSEPWAIAVNHVTNKVYVTNYYTNSLTVLDGATNTTHSLMFESGLDYQPTVIAVNPGIDRILAGSQKYFTTMFVDGATEEVRYFGTGGPVFALAVNPVLNEVFACANNFDSHGHDQLDFDSENGHIGSLLTDHFFMPRAVAYNPATGKGYVANEGSNSVVIFNGLSHSYITKIYVGADPIALAVNPVTDKIYVANSQDNTVSIIDGPTNGVVTTIPVGVYPCAVAVNPVTNKIYVAALNSDCVTVIDGATNTTTSVPTGRGPYALTINNLTNKIFVANPQGGNVTVIDGETNNTVTFSVGGGPSAIDVNPVTNKVYVANTDQTIAVIDGSTYTTQVVATGNYPMAVDVNPLTNKICSANSTGSSVSLIDGATNTRTNITTGASPRAIAFNSVTNKIYTANYSGNNVTCIDAATETAGTIPAGTNPVAVALNQLTNKIYVANYGSGDVTVIDGPTNTTSTVTAGSHPKALAVNYITNRIYAVNNSSNNVTVINGATNAASTVTVGAQPYSAAVNTSTNKIYVTNFGGNSVTVIDGATNSTSTVAVGLSPEGIAVNSLTNKIYVANYGANTVTVIDGATNSTSTIAVGNGPAAVSIDPVTNKIFVGNTGSNTVSVIDGVSNVVSATVTTGTNPFDIAVNPVTGKAYVADYSSSNNVIVISEQVMYSNPLSVSISPFTNDQTTNTAPAFNFTAATSYTPTAPLIRNAYYTVDAMQTGWTKAGGTRPDYTGSAGTLPLGTHYVYAYAVDGSDATSINTGSGISPILGGLSAYAFNIMPSVTAGGSDLNPVFSAGSSISVASLSFGSISGTALISALKVDRGGTASNSDVPTASLYIDKNKNNIVDAGDTQLGTTQTFSGSTPCVTFSDLNYYPNSTENLLVVYNVAAGAALTNTASAVMAADYITGQPGSTTVTFSGLSTGAKPLPVELSAFSANSNNGQVKLSWTTATEVNNYGFEVERKNSDNNIEWEKIGFINGCGNSNTMKSYSFIDDNPAVGQVQYRLKQIDINGIYKYYDPVVITIAAPKEYSLLQNSPNPFNPSTAIKFQLPQAEHVTIKIFDIQGREVATLLDEEKPAGSHIIYWNGKDSNNIMSSSGIYIYNITAGSFNATRKMSLLK